MIRLLVVSVVGGGRWVTASAITAAKPTPLNGYELLRLGGFGFVCIKNL